jgi:hypothetical protein
LVLLLRENGISEYLAVIVIHDWGFFGPIVGLADDEGLVDDFFIVKVGREQVGNDKVDYVVIADGEYFGHIVKCLALPEPLQLLLGDGEMVRFQFLQILQDYALEVVYVLHVLSYLFKIIAKLPHSNTKWTIYLLLFLKGISN